MAMTTKSLSAPSGSPARSTARRVVAAVYIAILGAAMETAPGIVGEIGIVIWISAVLVALIGAWRILTRDRSARSA